MNFNQLYFITECFLHKILSGVVKFLFYSCIWSICIVQHASLFGSYFGNLTSVFVDIMERLQVFEVIATIF